jgi:phage N-6-adenine-methyltransferase
MAALALVRSDVDRLEQLAAAANRAHRDGVRAAIAAGKALLEAKQLLPHGHWGKWIKEHCDFSERAAQMYMQAARHPETAGDSLREILGALRKPSRYSYCSGDEEWFTPQAVVEAVRQVLGTIDLDPASCTEANAVVKARRFYTIKDDGLRQPWRGRMFVNPPYSVTKISLFIEKLVGHVQDGSVTEAIVVVNSETEVRWFRSLSSVATGVCFPTGRIKFWKPGRKTGTSPLGQAIVYVGRRPKKFGRAFGRFGHVWFA